jgi:ferrous iron transport protein B
MVSRGAPTRRNLFVTSRRLTAPVRARPWPETCTAAGMSAALACPATLDRPEQGLATGAVLLVGNPNVGKSALFGALTGTYVAVSNYPGTTVEVTAGTLPLRAERVTALDTPGTASLLPASEDERVARDILLSGAPRAVVLVADAKNLERALLLAVELAEAGLPLVLCLNMIDEAEERGLHIDAAALERRLGVRVVSTVAVRRHGIDRLLAALESPRKSSLEIGYAAEVEWALRSVEPLLPEGPLSRRALALLAMSGDETLAPWLRARLDPPALAALEDQRQALARAVPESVGCLVHRTRRLVASQIARAVCRREEPVRSRSWLERLERLSTHRVWGLPILGLVLYAMYLFVGVLGAGTLVDLMEDGLFGRWINPAAVSLTTRLVPWAPLRDLLVGPYGIVTMALTYALALVLPIVGTFFIAFGALEDSGYLPRLAVMANGVFKKMGLNGKAVLPMVLGLGCDTMATLTTRILETPKERLIAILLLALGVPCSAQLAVVLGLLQPLPRTALVIWLAVVVGVIVLVGRLAALFLPGRRSDLVLELPPLRLPRPGNVLVKTLARIEWYLKEAVPLFVLGTLILFVADRLHALAGLQRLARPVVSGVLGLPPEAAEAFVIGFLRRDFGAAGLYRLASAGRLDPGQVLVSVVTMTLFIPCIASFFVIVKERGWRTALSVAGFVIPFAVAVGAALRGLLRLWPGLLS